MVVALAVIWIGLQHPVGRRLPDRPQPLEPVGPEHLDRHHGDGHGADHRVAQHRPVGRVAARVPRLHDGDGPDASGSPTRSDLGFDRWYTWIVALAVGIAARGRRSARSRGSSSPTSACRRSSSRSAGSWSGAASSSATPQGQTLAPLDGTFQLLGGGTRGLARRVEELAAGRASAARLIAFSLVARPAAASSPPASPSARLGVDIGLGVVGCLIVLGAVWLANSYSVAGPARHAVRRAPQHRRAGGRAEDPDRHRLPGRDPDRGRRW